MYEAIKHVYQHDKNLKPLVKEDSLYVNKNYFATEIERAIDTVRNDFREKH